MGHQRTLATTTPTREVSDLTPEENLRYSRHFLFRYIGRKGQQHLQHARVAIVGAGAIGSMLANHMARSGIGYIRLIDADQVEISNLQRQVLYTEEDATSQRDKAMAAKQHLFSINHHVDVDPRIIRINAENAEQQLVDVDLILDGTDNLESRFIINDVATKHHLPWIYAAAVGSRGMVFPFIPGRGPCFHCLFTPAQLSNTAETCDAVGVIGTAVAVVASLSATEALKILLGDTANVISQLRHLDLWKGEFGELKLGEPRQGCPTCGRHDYPFLA